MDSAWSLGILALWTVVLVLAVQLQFLRWTMLMFQRQQPPDEEDAQRPAVFLIVEPDSDARRQADVPLRARLERPPPVPVRQRRRRRRRRRRAVR